MIEFLEAELIRKPLPEDQLTGNPQAGFRGVGYVYHRTASGLEVVNICLDQAKPKPLPGFIYDKPEISSLSPWMWTVNSKPDEEPREGYYFLTLVRDALRPKLHLCKVEDAIFAATYDKTTASWGTRYFPQSCLEPEFWQQLLDLHALQT